MKSDSERIQGWAIYLRVSDEKKQHPEHSLEAQMQVIQERLIGRSDMPVLKVYKDIVSGQTSRRPQYQQMKRDAKAKMFTHLAVYRVDRLGRNTLEGLIAFQEFIELEIDVKTAGSPDIDPTTPDGKFFMGMQMLMAQHETEIMKVRMDDSKRAILRQGGWPFNAPDGYLNKKEAITNGKFRTWIESDPPRLQMWREAYDMLLGDQLTLAEICHELHNRGYVRSTGKPWIRTLKNGQTRAYDNKLSRGLNRPFYAGRVVSKHYGVHYEDEIQGHWEPIVSVEEYERALEILRRRDHNKIRQQRHIYLLRDLLSVRDGGSSFKMYCSSPTGRSKTYSYYYTRAKINGSKLHVPCETIDEQMPEYLEDIAIPDDLLRPIRRLYKQHIAELNGPDRDEQLDRLRQQINQLREEEADLVRLLLQKRLSQDMYDRLRHEWQTKLNKKQQEMEALQRDVTLYVDDLEAAIALLSSAPILFARLPRKKQAQLLKLIFSEIIVDIRGRIQTVQLNAPFAYLRSAAELVQMEAHSELDALNQLTNSPKEMSFPERAYAIELQTTPARLEQIG